MRFLGPIAGIPLLIFTSVGISQDTLCDPCVDGPEMIRRPARLFSNVDISPSEIAGLIRTAGGTLRDLTHDCGRSIRTSHEEIEFSARVCQWGGRYPALLIEPGSADDTRSVVVLASDGEKLEVLFEEAAPASLVNAFGALLKEDFDRMFQALSELSGG